jgi:hypothetical protein
MTTAVIAHAPNRVPLWLKFAYTAFMMILVPVYWHYYGPTNFLYFCDVALFLTLAGLWLDSALLISMCAVGILAMQTLWGAGLRAQHLRPAGDRRDRLHVQARELVVPSRTIAVSRLAAVPAGLSGVATGLCRKGFRLWTVLAWALMLISFFFLPPPDPNAGLKPVNIN